MLERVITWADVAVIDGGECGIESGQEGVRCGIARDRYHHLSHEILHIYKYIRRSLQLDSLVNNLR